MPQDRGFSWPVIGIVELDSATRTFCSLDPTLVDLGPETEMDRSLQFHAAKFDDEASNSKQVWDIGY